ncbi:unnamed protein product, partial [Ceratitis capitata]
TAEHEATNKKTFSISSQFHHPTPKLQRINQIDSVNNDKEHQLNDEYYLEMNTQDQ